MMGSYTNKLRRSKGFWLIAGLIFYPAALAAFSQADMEKKIRQEEAKLAVLKDKIGRWEENMPQNKEKEHSILTRLERIDRRLEIMGKELEIYDWNLKVAEIKEKELEGLTTQNSGKLKMKKSLLRKKLRALYKISRYSNPISSPDNSSFLLRKYLQESILSDIGSITQDEKTQAVALKNQIALQKKQERIRLYKERVLRQKGAIEQEKTAKEQLLATIKDERKIYEETQKEFKEASKKLSALVKGLQSQDKNEFVTRDFRAKKGNLSWPVKGEIITFFGRVKHPRFNYYIFNKGIDIRAQLGSSILAIDSGKVLFADWVRGYGNLLIIDHGEGYYSLYAHLSNIYVKVRELIKKGQPVAALGDSGSLIGASLYFEIRHHGNPENPLHWLAKKP